MDKQSLKMIDVKYSEKGINILKNIQITIPENQWMGIVSNSSAEISALKKILILPKTNYGGYIFCYGNLLKKDNSSEESEILNNNIFDVFNFDFFNERIVIDIFNQQISSSKEMKNKIAMAKANWEKVFLSNNKKVFNEEIKINLELVNNQKKLITNFFNKWNQKIKTVFNFFQLKKYKEFLTFLESYENDRLKLYVNITNDFIKCQNSILNLYLDIEQKNSDKEVFDEIEKLSDILADGNVEIIQEIQKEIMNVNYEIKDLNKKVKKQESENKILWTKILHDLSLEISGHRKLLKSNNLTTTQKIFWYKKNILLKTQFERLQKFKSRISKLNSDQFLKLLQDYKVHNDTVIVDSFPALSFSKKSKKIINSDIKQRNNFNFYTYELESIENEKSTIKIIDKLEAHKIELEKKLSNKSLYNEKQVERQKKEVFLIQKQILADRNWDINIRKTELTTVVINIKRDKQRLLESYNAICNWLVKADEKMLSLIGKMDLIFSFFSKKDRFKIQNQKYRMNFKQYLEQDFYFSHLKTIEHFFDNPQAAINLKYGLVLHSLTNLMKIVNFDTNLLWKQYKKLNEAEKLKVNLILSQFLNEKLYILDFENNEIKIEEKKCVKKYSRIKVVLYLILLKILKNEKLIIWL